jgi:hypothetical protein
MKRLYTASNIDSKRGVGISVCVAPPSLLFQGIVALPPPTDARVEFVPDLPCVRVNDGFANSSLHTFPLPAALM